VSNMPTGKRMRPPLCNYCECKATKRILYVTAEHTGGIYRDDIVCDTHYRLPLCAEESSEATLALLIQTRREEVASRESRKRVTDSFEPLDEAVCLAFRNAPATLAPESVWPLR
jgi:hypothetical protein